MRLRTHELLCAAAFAAVAAAGPAAAAPGDLDPTFSSDGKVVTRFPNGSTEIFDIAVQRDGKVVAAGAFGPEDTADFALARYRPNGKLDRSFSGNGRVTLRFGPGDAGAQVHAIVIQPNGKIVAAGYIQTGSDYDLALARFLPNGRLDRTFGGDGKVRTSFGTYAIAHALVRQPSGKIVVGGTVRSSDYMFAAFRYRRNGSVDRSFGPNGNGRVVTPVEMGFAGVAGAAVQPDGKIILAGSAMVGGNLDFAVVRYRRNGTLDPGFGSGGIATTPIVGTNSDRANGVALQPDGKIVAAGETQDLSSDADDFALVRYTANGTPDPTFGSAGVVTTPVGPDYDSAEDVVVQRSGRIVVAGFTFGTPTRFAIVRYTAGGAPDPRFGSGGVVTPTVGSGNSLGLAAALRADGRIVVGGEAASGTRRHFALVGLLGKFPRVSIRGDSRLEGDGGERVLRFPIRLSEPPGTTPVDVSYETIERSAVAPQDYLSEQGEFRFSGARTLRWVRVVVFGDRRVEPNERFRVRISLSGNATLGRARARGTIRNDD